MIFLISFFLSKNIVNHIYHLYMFETPNKTFVIPNYIFFTLFPASRSSKRKKRHKPYAFLGRAILREVIRELSEYEQLLRSDNQLFLAGSSAGATGVMINVDEVAQMVAKHGVKVGSGFSF